MPTQHPPKHTRVNEAYDALLSKIRAQPEIDERLLVDGGRPINYASNYILMFGFRPGTEEWVSVTRTSPGGMRPNDVEVITIGLLIAATDRNGSMSAARALVAEKLKAVERAVTADMTLGIPGANATIPSHSWTPVYTSKGAECNVTIDVRIEVPLA